MESTAPDIAEKIKDKLMLIGGVVGLVGSGVTESLYIYICNI